jgi:DNA-binding NarL/FixJ family response regulator
MGGLDFIKNVKSYNIKAKILILSMHMSSNIIHDAILAGANGFIMKQNATRDEIMTAITHLSTGENYFTDEIINTLNKKTKAHISNPVMKFEEPDISGLTRSELQVLQLFADGHSNKEIAQKLNLNLRTIENHKSHIKSKLNLKSNIEMIKFAIKNNICYL